jgi:hypothetical protein
LEDFALEASLGNIERDPLSRRKGKTMLKQIYVSIKVF